MWDNNIIDLNEAIARVLGYKEMYKRWLDDFFVPGTMETVKTAFIQKDYEAAHKAVHKLKGTAANLAILKLAEQARALDEQIKQNKPFEHMMNEYEQLLNYFDNADVMYKENENYILDYKIDELIK